MTVILVGDGQANIFCNYHVTDIPLSDLEGLRQRCS